MFACGKHGAKAPLAFLRVRTGRAASAFGRPALQVSARLRFLAALRVCAVRTNSFCIQLYTV